MFSSDSFNHVSLMALALAARRIASGIMHGDVIVRPIENPSSWWGGITHPDRGYFLSCRGETVAEVVELNGRAYADWCVQYDPEGAEAFESALVAEADAAHAVAETVRSIEAAGGIVDGAGVNVVGQAAGEEPVAWLEYEDADGDRDRVYFHGAAEAKACLCWASAHDLMEE